MERMKKRIMIFLLLVIGVALLLISGLLICRYSIGRFAESMESQYASLNFKGIEEGTISFVCETDVYDKDAFFPGNCIDIKEAFEKRYGILLFPYRLEINILQLNTSDNNSDIRTIGGSILTFKDYKAGGYSSVVIDNSQYGARVLDSISYYSEYDCFSKYEIYGALFTYPRLGEKEVDDTFLTYACKNAKIITDDHTYNEYIDLGCFKDVLSDYDANDVEVLEKDQRIYSRPAIH